MEDVEMAELLSAVPTSVGEKVRQLRKSRGLSQGALAERMKQLGLTSWRQTTVAKVEAVPTEKNPDPTLRPLSLQEAVALSWILGAGQIDWLLDRDAADALLARSAEVAEIDFQRILQEARNTLPPERAAFFQEVVDAAVPAIREALDAARGRPRPDSVPFQQRVSQILREAEGQQ